MDVKPFHQTTQLLSYDRTEPSLPCQMLSVSDSPNPLSTVSISLVPPTTAEHAELETPSGKIGNFQWQHVRQHPSYSCKTVTKYLLNAL